MSRLRVLREKRGFTQVKTLRSKGGVTQYFRFDIM